MWISRRLCGGPVPAKKLVLSAKTFKQMPSLKNKEFPHPIDWCVRVGVVTRCIYMPWSSPENLGIRVAKQLPAWAQPHSNARVGSRSRLRHTAVPARIEDNIFAGITRMLHYNQSRARNPQHSHEAIGVVYLAHLQCLGVKIRNEIESGPIVVKELFCLL